jgi:hypothetical protein
LTAEVSQPFVAGEHRRRITDAYLSAPPFATTHAARCRGCHDLPIMLDNADLAASLVRDVVEARPRAQQLAAPRIEKRTSHVARHSLDLDRTSE